MSFDKRMLPVVLRVVVSVVLIMGPWAGLGTACASCDDSATAAAPRTGNHAVEAADCCRESAAGGGRSSEGPAPAGPIPCHLKSCCVQFAPVGTDTEFVVWEKPVAGPTAADDGVPGTRRDRPPVPPPRHLTGPV